MKKDTRHNLGWAARMRLVGRVIGLIGLFTALTGYFFWRAAGRNIVPANVVDVIRTGTGTANIAAWLMACGMGVAALVLLVELFAWLGGSGRRSATGANSTFQVLLALAVFGAVNYFTFGYFKRWDLTRDRQFTLPTQVASDLRKLDGKTTIVVLQRHKTFGQLSDKPDVYDFAAERKVVDKVRDLVDQFRLLGPQFNVVTLDVEAEGYQDELDKQGSTRPGLKEAIAAAPDNSIFFYADDRVETISAEEATRRSVTGRLVHTAPGESGSMLAYEGNIQRLSFNEFYLLDKSASRTANMTADGKSGGNLVLRPQGVESFARRVLAIQEKRPKVGLLSIHEYLTTALSEGGQESFTAAGLRRALEDHGMEVVDVILKKWGETGGPAPAAYNLQETQFERLEAEREGIDEQRRDLLEERKDFDESQKLLREKSLAELDRMFRARIRREFTEELRQDQLSKIAELLKQVDERLAELDNDRRESDARMAALLGNERAFEDRRVSDVKAKLTRLVADCDLLIVPRLTIMNASAIQSIDPPLYRLSTDQVAVVKEFMKSGKPVLVCAGPNAETNQPASAEPLDDLERLLADRGIHLGRETIITMAEAKGFAARRAGGLLGGAPTELPPVSFPPVPKDKADNPIAAAMRAIAASADQNLELRVRNPRPVYLAAGLENKTKFAAEFLLSPANAWNEESPMMMRNIGGGRAIVSPPRFRATPFGDPKRGTRDEVRRGPFPIGVAVESPLPTEWFDKDFGGLRGTAATIDPLGGSLLSAALTAQSKFAPEEQRRSGRLAVIGSGGIFTGKQLSPASEQLLLHTCNWLLQRDERLPKTEQTWQYPRLHREEQATFGWKYGPIVFLSSTFLFLGVLSWLFRRVR